MIYFYFYYLREFKCFFSGFHEAIGELMAMAAATPRHLHKLGLMKELVEDDEQVRNKIYSTNVIITSPLVRDIFTFLGAS